MEDLDTINNHKNPANDYNEENSGSVQLETELLYEQAIHCDSSQWSASFKCAVPSCESEFNISNKSKELSQKFHNFPVAEHVANVWKQLCGLPITLDVTNLKVCTNHFNLSDYNKLLNQYVLKSDAIPIKRMPVIDPDLEAIRNVVDLNEQLKEKHDYLLREQSKFKETIIKYTTKIENKQCRLLNLKKQIAEFKRKVGRVKKGKTIIGKVFSPAQIDLLKGRKKVVWSEDDLAMGFALRHVGTKECYLYLKNTLNLPLPALSCVQKWAASL